MADITRRDLIEGGIGLVGLAAAGGLVGCGNDNDSGSSGGPPPAEFPQAPELVSSNGMLEFPMDIIQVINPVGTPEGVRDFRSRTFNGRLAGETLRIRAGDKLTVPIRNNLPLNPDTVPPDKNTPHHFNTVNLHTHGFHVSPFQDDVLIDIHPTEVHTYEYDIPADHPAGTMWYHPHKHGATAMHLFSGMSGVIIIEGDASNGDLNSVPEIAAAEEIIFNINELVLDGFGADPDKVTPYEVPPYTTPKPFLLEDRVFVVNGVYQPRLKVVPGQVLRLRILNSSARHTIPLKIENTDMHLCAMDGITIPAVRTVDTVTLAPANRADVLVKFDAEGTYKISGGEFLPEVLAFVDVAGERFDMPLATGALPTVTSLPDIEPAEVTESRVLTYAVDNDPPTGPEIPTGGARAPNFTIDGVRFDPNTVNQELDLNSVIEWTLTNTSEVRHPHHIHIHPFQVIETSDNMLNGMPFPPPGDPGWVPAWLDTVAIPEKKDGEGDGFVRVRQRYPDNPGFYVIHCHILVHEDIGMMQLVHLS
jgi:FtsP/CotA-like multicopper oxidase with cupredoxin domain